MQDLAIADDSRFNPDAPFVKAQEIDVSVKLVPLIHKQVEINSLSLQRPSVNLIKNHSGEWSFASLGHPQEKQPTSTEQQFSVGELTIQDGQVSLLDQAKSTTPSLYDHIDVTLRNFAPNQPFTIDAAVHMAGAGSEDVRLQGEGGPLLQQDLLKTSFHGNLDLKQVGVADFSKFLNSPASH